MANVGRVGDARRRDAGARASSSGVLLQSLSDVITSRRALQNSLYTFLSSGRRLLLALRSYCTLRNRNSNVIVDFVISDSGASMFYSYGLIVIMVKFVIFGTDFKVNSC